MGKHGPKPKRADGCHVTADGYLRRLDYKAGRNVLEHRRVWAAAHGPIPLGYTVHHKNRDKQDNRLENLELLSHDAHGRHHRRQRLVDGRWLKVCGECGVEAAIDTDWYFYAYAHKPCHKKRVVERKRRLRAMRRVKA